MSPRKYNRHTNIASTGQPADPSQLHPDPAADWTLSADQPVGPTNSGSTDITPPLPPADHPDNAMHANDPVTPDVSTDSPPPSPSKLMAGSPADAPTQPDQNSAASGLMGTTTDTSGQTESQTSQVNPTYTDHPADPATLALLIKAHDLEGLWNRAEKAQERINKEVNNIDLAKELLEKLRSARNDLMSGRSRYDYADLLIGEVEHRISYYSRMLGYTKSIAPWLFGYELLMLAIMGGVIAFSNISPIMVSINHQPPGVDITQFMNALAWGSLGGVVGALYALWKHVADAQDFDPQYSMWYFTNPILGLALGAFVFLIIQAGFVSMSAGSTVSTGVQSGTVIYVLAWICGFKQNVVYEIVRRILDVFKVNPSDSTNTPTTPPAQG